MNKHTLETRYPCPLCHRLVSIRSDGALSSHGPGPKTFLCRGSGLGLQQDKEEVEARAAIAEAEGADPAEKEPTP